MSSGDFNAIGAYALSMGTFALVIGFFILLAMGSLRLGELLNRRYPRATGSALWATIHVLALFAFLIGCLLARMVYYSDAPLWWVLLLPFVLPLVIYGSLFIGLLKSLAFVLVIRAVSTVFISRREH